MSRTRGKRSTFVGEEGAGPAVARGVGRGTGGGGGMNTK